jgi:dipeptidyl aminopeptidase/acylaminoacyl peptidase
VRSFLFFEDWSNHRGDALNLATSFDFTSRFGRIQHIRQGGLQPPKPPLTVSDGINMTRGTGNSSFFGGDSRAHVAKFSAVFVLVIATLLSSSAFGQRPFTAKDDVGLALFEYAGRGAPGGVIKFSPDGQYFAVVTERGRLDLNAPEDTIWVFRIEDVQRFVQHPEQGNPPTALPLAQMATDRDGPLIENVRWLPDSSGIAFTAVKKSSRCKFHQLFVADVGTHAVKTLTPEDQDVGEFDIRSATHYVYEINAPELLAAPKEDQQPAVVLTGKSLWTTVFPNVEHHLSPFDAVGLWAVTDGNRRQVLDVKSYDAPPGLSSLSLSPDGRSVVAILKTDHPPETNWARYKAPPGYDKFKLPLDTSAYHLIDLTSGTKKLLINAPYGMNQDWHSYLLTASWSADGQSLLLPGTFFPLDVTDPKEVADRERHPYIAVLRLKTGELSKVLAVKAGLDKERYAVQDARFEDDRTVVVNFDRSNFLPDQPPAAIFHQEADGSWRQAAGTEDPRRAKLPIKVEKREGINQPPLIVAEDKVSHVSRTIWDPNPQLREIALGTAEVIHWKDDTGYEWEAGLVKPPDYTVSKRYPLVIQTHGFSKGQFLSSGIFTTAFAARALAAQGIVVLQMGWNPNNFATPKEGPDQVVGFESLVKKLTEDAVIDPARVGVIGFSRSVYHVLAAITTARHPFAAASVTDGVTFGYFEYLFAVDSGDWEADAINGGKPFGAEGLQNWLARSPEFNMDKARTPLLLLQPGAPSVFADWEPYAALRYLKKPVDLIMLQTGTHVMTNPTQRLASETSNVDWFRFWLKGEEDADPTKAEQYTRWRELRRLQQTDETGQKSN